MPRIKIKNYRPQVTVTVRTLWKESFYTEQCDLLKNNYTAGLMRLVSVNGSNADFSAPADMKICDMLRSGIDKETYFKIIAQVVNVLRWVQTQKLSVSNLNLNTDYVFVNSQTKELFLLYVPVNGDAENGNLKEFLRQLVFESSFKLGEDTGFKQELMNLLNSGSSPNSKTLEQYAVKHCPQLEKSFEKFSEQKKSNVAASKSEYLRQMEALENEDRSERNYTWNDTAKSEYEYTKNSGGLHRDDYSDRKRVGKGTDLFYDNSRMSSAVTSGTVLLDANDGAGNGTVVLDNFQNILGTVILDESTYPEKVSYPKLIRRSTGDEISIDKPVFRIGKEEGTVDYLIPDNPTISRSHADIISRGGRYFLYDNNSTNRSYVNNVIVESLKNIEIYDGTVIRLSDEEFEFRILNY